MEFINLIGTIFIITSVNGYVLDYADEDRILDMLLSDNYILNEPNVSEEVPKEQKPIFMDGVWLCGNCSDITEVSLIYNESYDVETTYLEEMELQIGFSLDNMRCIKISADEDAQVESVSGACAGDAVTLKVMNTNKCDISIYG